MKSNDSVTLCLTIGRRPLLLEKTLTSLLKWGSFKEIIAINDFRDEPTNLMFRNICPNGHLISLNHHLGHHRAVDEMYKYVTTPWIFHCEDDWFFDAGLILEKYQSILIDNPSMVGLCLRSTADFGLSDSDRSRILVEHHGDLQLHRMDTMHSQWHGYTFNPHLINIDRWKTFGPWSQFKKERHISRAFRAHGMYMPYIGQGGCRHIGEDQSVANPPKIGFWSRWISS